MFTSRPHRKAFTMLELIVVIVILGILALLAIPTFSKVITRTQDASALTTLQSVARDAQTLRAIDDVPWAPTNVEAAITETPANYAGGPGVLAAASYAAHTDPDSDPDNKHIAYAATGQGLVVSTRSQSGKICIVGADYSSTTPGSCKLPPEWTAKSGAPTSIGGALSDGGILPPMTVTTPIVTTPVTPTPPTVVTVAQPSNLTATNPAPGAVALTWTASPNATDYVIFRDGLKVGSPVTTTSFSEAGLNEGTQYSYTVEARVGTFTSVPSAPAKIFPSSGVVTGIVVSDVSAFGAKITWTPVPGATGYRVEYRTSPTAAPSSVTSATNSVTLSGLKATTEYTLTVQATRADSPSPSGSVKFSTPDAAVLKTWTAMTAMPAIMDPATANTTKTTYTSLTAPSAVSYNGKLYIVGGSFGSGNTPSSYLLEYTPDAGKGTWTTKSPIPQGLQSAASVVVGDKLYVFGGRNGFNATISKGLYIYNFTTNSWTAGPDMPTTRYAGGVATVNGIIYLIGGTVASSTSSNVLAYNPATNTYDTTRSPLPRALIDMGVSVYNGKIYVTGGSPAPSSNAILTQIYDVTTNQWSQGTSVPSVTLSGHSTSVVAGRLYTVGGTGPANTVRVLDIASGVWSTTTDRPAGTPKAITVVIDDQVYSFNAYNVTGSSSAGTLYKLS